MVFFISFTLSSCAKTLLPEESRLQGKNAQVSSDPSEETVDEEDSFAEGFTADSGPDSPGIIEEDIASEFPQPFAARGDFSKEGKLTSSHPSGNPSADPLSSNPSSGLSKKDEAMLDQEASKSEVADLFNTSQFPDKKKQIARTLPFKPTQDLVDIFFEFDQYTLSRVALDTLRNNAMWLKEHPSTRVQIEGHCDERGTNNYNLGLGQQRALAIKKYLVSLGVEQERLYTMSYGEEKPFCFENGESCWKLNRRSHFRIAP
ncbi:MAG: peptidoglycan-associated lipoprotein Pal [Candidatus Nitronauta litoralis]|uniref:Peptidoglycan-associated protein n=1 Tax=Candidatus Nitronauta litoralis TaxID=2705533 RepID=A0A7T0BW26_9BACT|nr:MAG: peptidoglycan-associated lipoprotein Pal [Candidatus Nitronauta litoralis]